MVTPPSTPAAASKASPPRRWLGRRASLPSTTASLSSSSSSPWPPTTPLFILSVMSFLLLLMSLPSSSCHDAASCDAQTDFGFLSAYSASSGSSSSASSSSNSIESNSNMPNVRRLKVTEDQQGSTSTDTTSSKQQRQLHFSDLTIGSFLGKGSISAVYQVELPQWWHDEEQEKRKNQGSNSKTPPPSSFAIKIAEPFRGKIHALKEARALHLLNEQNPVLARQLHIPPLVWNYTQDEGDGDDEGEILNHNPYYIRLRPGIRQPTPAKSWQRLRNHPRVFALIVPNYNHVSDTNQGQHKQHRNHWNVLDDYQDADYPLATYRRVKRFAYTFLATLDYAHDQCGVNVNDIQRTNVHADAKGNAIVADWNECKVANETLFDDSFDFQVTPPEGHFDTFPVVKNDKNDKDIRWEPARQVSVGAYDIWSAGILLARILWETTDGENEQDSCSLMRFPYGDREQRGQAASADYFEYLHRRGLKSSTDTEDSTLFRLNEAGDWTDLSSVIPGLNDTTTTQDSWKLPLCQTASYWVSNYKETCRPCQSPHTRGVLSRLYADQNRLAWARRESSRVMDLIRQMLTINPHIRPTAGELLQHPLFEGMSLEKLAEWDEQQQQPPARMGAATTSTS